MSKRPTVRTRAAARLAAPAVAFALAVAALAGFATAKPQDTLFRPDISKPRFDGEIQNGRLNVEYERGWCRNVKTRKWAYGSRESCARRHGDGSEGPKPAHAGARTAPISSSTPPAERVMKASRGKVLTQIWLPSAQHQGTCRSTVATESGGIKTVLLTGRTQAQCPNVGWKLTVRRGRFYDPKTGTCLLWMQSTTKQGGRVDVSLAPIRTSRAQCLALARTATVTDGVETGIMQGVDIERMTVTRTRAGCRVDNPGNGATFLLTNVPADQCRPDRRVSLIKEFELRLRRAGIERGRGAARAISARRIGRRCLARLGDGSTVTFPLAELRRLGKSCTAFWEVRRLRRAEPRRSSTFEGMGDSHARRARRQARRAVRASERRFETPRTDAVRMATAARRALMMALGQQKHRVHSNPSEAFSSASADARKAWANENRAKAKRGPRPKQAKPGGSGAPSADLPASRPSDIARACNRRVVRRETHCCGQCTELTYNCGFPLRETRCKTGICTGC